MIRATATASSEPSSRSLRSAPIAAGRRTSHATANSSARAQSAGADSENDGRDERRKRLRCRRGQPAEQLERERRAEQDEERNPSGKRPAHPVADREPSPAGAREPVQGGDEHRREQGKGEQRHRPARNQLPAPGQRSSAEMIRTRGNRARAASCSAALPKRVARSRDTWSSPSAPGPRGTSPLRCQGQGIDVAAHAAGPAVGASAATPA